MRRSCSRLARICHSGSHPVSAHRGPPTSLCRPTPFGEFCSPDWHAPLVDEHLNSDSLIEFFSPHTQHLTKQNIFAALVSKWTAREHSNLFDRYLPERSLSSLHGPAETMGTKHGPSLACIGQIWPEFGQVWSNLFQVGPLLIKLGQVFAICCGRRATISQKRLEIAVVRAILAYVCGVCPEIGVAQSNYFFESFVATSAALPGISFRRSSSSVNGVAHRRLLAKLGRDFAVLAHRPIDLTRRIGAPIWAPSTRNSLCGGTFPEVQFAWVATSWSRSRAWRFW